jgi:PAS domain S-box-containing protein
MAAKRPIQDASSLPASVYRRLVECARDIILVLDIQGNIRFINEAVTRVLGYRPDDVLGRNVEEFYHPQDRQRGRDSLGRTLKVGASEQMEIYRLRHRDGSYRQLESLANNRIDDTSVGGILLIARDVTERLAAEAQRAHLEAQRQFAARIARLGIWEWNSRTDELVASEAVRHLARAEPDQQWSGFGGFLQRLVEEDRAPARRALRGAAAGKHVEGLVVRMPLPDGTLRWLYLHAQNMQLDGPPSDWVLGLVMDVTEQQRAREEITRRGELLELATWGADVGVWTWLPDEDRAEYSIRCGELLGISTERLECATEDLYQPIHPDDLPELKRLEAELLAGKTDVFNYAYRVRQGTEDWHWVMDRGRVSERDARGRVTRVSGVTLDVDDVKRREHELEDQRLRLDLALDASALGLWDFDLVRNEVFVDERYAGIVGLSAKVLRHDSDEFVRQVHEEDRPRLLAAGAACLEGRAGNLYFEGRLLRSDDRMIRVRVQGFVASRKPDGQPARMIGTIADISDPLREEQLRRTGEMVASVGSYEFEVGGDRAYWSEGFLRIFELPADYVPVRGAALNLIAPSDRPILIAASRAAEADGTEFDIEVRGVSAKGKDLWLRIIGRTESFGGRPQRVFGVVQDITERKQLESELLEAANREQQKLGSDLHDGLGQELTGISLLLQGLSQRIRSADPSLTGPIDRISALLSRAIRSTRSLAHGLAPVSVDRGGLEGALKTLADEASDSYRVAVHLQFRWDRGPAVGEVAGNHIYRIVQESINNAVRHGRAGSIIIDVRPTPENLVLEVTDDGCGIVDEALRKGGFGLRSMRYRTQSIGGTLSVERVTAGGTRVRLLCPRRDA